MPSFSTIFVVAATAFAAFSSAAPTGPAPGVNQVYPAKREGLPAIGNLLGGTLGSLGGLVGAPGGVAPPLHGDRIKRDQAGSVLGLVNGLGLGGVDDLVAQGGQPAKRDSVLNDALNMLPKTLGDMLDTRDEEPKSLPTILVNVKAELDAVLAHVSDVVDGKVDVDIEILKPIFGQVAVIVANAVVNVKVIIGHPADFILSLDGKVLAVVDVCHLLVSVLVTVHAILALCLHVVAKDHLQVCATLVAHVGAIVAQLLVVIFVDLKVGIFAAIGSILTPAFLEALAVIKLDAVVAVLKNGHA